jgi:hypothetical protein
MKILKNYSIPNNKEVTYQPNLTITKHIKTPNHISTTSQNQQKCRLCNNQHPNPWHPTKQWPFKDPTYIQNKLIKENAIQHNTLCGKINKNYSKNMDTPTNQNKLPKAFIPTTAKIADFHL